MYDYHISHPQHSPQPQDGLAFEFGEEVKGVRPLNAFAEEARMGCSSHWEDPLVWSGENDGKNDGLMEFHWMK